MERLKNEVGVFVCCLFVDIIDNSNESEPRTMNVNSEERILIGKAKITFASAQFKTQVCTQN